jgi:hypothetical protein
LKCELGQLQGQFIRIEMSFGHFRNSSLRTLGSMRPIPRIELVASTVTSTCKLEDSFPPPGGQSDADRFSAKRAGLNLPGVALEYGPIASCKPDGWATPRRLAADCSSVTKLLAFHEALELARASSLAQLAHRLRLDLANPATSLSVPVGFRKRIAPKGPHSEAEVENL